MVKKRFVFVLLAGIFLGACVSKKSELSVDEPEFSMVEESSFDVQKMKSDMVEAAYKLERSEAYNNKFAIIVTAMGMDDKNQDVSFDDTYLLPAIEAKTGIRFNIDWKSESEYSTAVATTILSSENDLPDMISPMNFGVMDLADDELIVCLDDYLDLMPDIVAAVGEEGMKYWREADGHIYTIPSITPIKGSFATMVRKDWLDELDLDVPNSWDEWVIYWKAVLENDLNHNGDPNDEIPCLSSTAMNGERCLVPFLNSFGIKASEDGQFCILDDGTYSLVYEHPRYNSFLEEMNKLYSEGILIEGYENISQAQLEQLMISNRVGTAMTYTSAAMTAISLRENGVSDALYVSTLPIPGVFGNRHIPEQSYISDSWCITKAALRRGKAADIVRFFNWCYTQEGQYLLNYGIEGISYDLIDGKPVMNKDLVANGFRDPTLVGIHWAAFGGCWLEDQYMQCLFSGKEFEEFSDIQMEVYKGIKETNTQYYYKMPKIIETDMYVARRPELITRGVCDIRNKAISGQISIEDFWRLYRNLRNSGLGRLVEEVNLQYQNMQIRGEENE